MIRVIAIAKTSDNYIQTGLNEYLNRIKHFHKLEYLEIPALKNTKKLSEQEQKREEGKLILKQIKPVDHLVIMDENGSEFNSEKMATQLDKKLASFQNVVFVIGGPYGFSAEIRDRANAVWSLSKLTFSHQMVRLFLLEQIYRSFTILKGLPYHHK